MKDSIMLVLQLAAKTNVDLRYKMRERVFGNKDDVVTTGDCIIGEKIIKSLLCMKPKKVVESEEFGKQDNLQGEKNEEYYVAIDDIDGTNNLRIGAGMLPYASMIVAFNGSNKTEKGYKYSDYAYAACIEYTTGKIFYTEKGLGEVVVYDINGNKIMSSSQNMQNNKGLVPTLGVDNVSAYRGGDVGYAATGDALSVSNEPGILDAVYRNFATVDSGCSVFEYAMVGIGVRNGYVAKGKKQHELPLLYAFCKETGQEMVDFDGNSYDDKIYEFSGKNAEVIAGSSRIIDRVRRCINLQKNQMLRVSISPVTALMRDNIFAGKKQPGDGGR